MQQATQNFTIRLQFFGKLHIVVNSHTRGLKLAVLQQAFVSKYDSDQKLVDISIKTNSKSG